MPLVLHPSSCCDVCLDSYTFQVADDAPHAIPCGHIFCRACLVTVEPTNCPLCRKAFNRERIKKLHVDRPETDTEADLLQRVALAFDAETVTKAQLSTDLAAWLAGRSDDDHLALRKAWSAFKAYDQLNDRKAYDKQKIKRYERMLTQRNEENEYDRDTFKAVESSLLAQVSELNAQIADLEGQVNPLRHELAKYQHTKNPLPAPPEPVPLDRFPPFARATAESAEGYASYFTPNGGPGVRKSSPRDLVEQRADKGKGKQPQSAYAIYQQPMASTTGNVIIPGASPSQRVIPTETVSGHAYHTHAPATAYVDGYATGFGQGYGAASAGVGAEANYASTSAHQLPPQPRADESEISLENALGSMQLWGAPTASAAIAPIVARPPDSAPATMPLTRRRAYIAPPHSNTEDDASLSSHPTTSYVRPSALRRSTVQIDGHLDEAQAPSAWQPPPIYAPAHSEAMVRFSTQTRDDGQIVANDAVERRAAQERRLNRQSYSSWGTVHTNGTENSPAGTRGSMSELGDIINFNHAVIPVESRRNSASLSDEILDRGMSATPRQEGSRLLLGFREAASVYAHSYSLPSIETVQPAPHQYDANSLQRAQRTVPRRFSQLPVGASEFGAQLTMAAEAPPIENALGLDLGAEATQTHTITAPTPRVQMNHYVRSWSLDPSAR